MKKKPINENLYQAVAEEYRAKDGQTIGEINQEIENKYVSRIKRYFGNDYPAFEGEVTPRADCRQREVYPKKESGRKTLKTLTT